MKSIPWEAISMVALFCIGGIFTGYRILLSKIMSVEEKVRHECQEVNIKFEDFKNDVYRNYTQKVDIDSRFKSIENKIDKIQESILELFGKFPR